MARHTSRAGRRAGRILLGLSALAALVVLLVGVPLVLLVAWRHLGSPVLSWQELTLPWLFVASRALSGRTPVRQTRSGIEAIFGQLPTAYP